MSERGGTATSRILSPLKWHIDGGKSFLAARIVALMPYHLVYCEPYAGGLSVLLAKNPNNCSEVINDLYGDLTNFWRVLQDEAQFERFKRRCEATPFSENDYVAAAAMEEFPPTEDWLRAWAFFVRCRLSLAGRMDSFAPLSRNRTRRGMNEQASAWISAVDGLAAVHERLRRVVVLNRDACDVILQQDGPNTCFFADPPYVPETRSSTGQYEHEMSVEDHVKLLSTLEKIEGKFLLSGYRSKLYDEWAERNGFARQDFEIANHASAGKSKRTMTESVWMNF
jgi:DNA adenine methylase